METVPPIATEPAAADPANAGVVTGGTVTARPVPSDDAEVAARLRLSVGRLSRRIRQQVVGEVTQSQVSVLTSIERLGRPTLGELAASEQVQPPSMTRQVEALEVGGLITRIVDPSDRRVARVELTSSGRRALARNRSLRTAYLVRTIARLSPEERERLGELVALLEHLAELA
jgi:DNA-binding MarR family transcriptional regulator